MRPANGTPPADGGGIANARFGRRRRAAASRTHMSTRSSTRRSASPASLPRARKASYSAAACVLSSSSTSSSTGSHAWPFASNTRCSRGFQSGMANPSDAIQRQEERVPRRTLCRERFSARAREAVVAPTPLSRTLDPAPVDQALVFKAIERRVQRRGVKGDGAVRPFFDQLADFVAVALAFVEQRQNEDFGAPPLQLALEQSCRHMWRDYICKTGGQCKQASPFFSILLAILPAIARTIELTHEGHAMLTILADVAQDIRYVSRTLRRSPGFAAAIIVTLALGVGANTAVFSVVNAVLLRPLPYPNPDRIVMLMNTWRGRVSPSSGVSPPKIILWRQSTTAFTDIATYTFGRSLNLTNPRDPHVIGVARVSIDFFRLFGARVAQGRAFSAAEDRPGGPHVAVISDRFWRNQLGQSSRAIGQAVSLDSDLFTVIGVLDSDFDGRALSPSLADGPDIWLPLQMDPGTTSDLNVYFAAARLREGVSFELARTETANAANVVRRTFPGAMPVDNGLSVDRLQAVFVREVRPALLLLWAAVTVVLLIACANTVNLLLVRASVREREMAIRVATGASGGRIVRQLLTESVALAMAGGGAGLVVGAIGTRVLLSIQAWNLPSFGPEGSRVAMDVHVLAFTLITSLGIGVAFGVVPALRAMRVDVDDQLKTGSRGTSEASGHRLRSGVVVVEVSLALMLLVGAALLIRSFVAVRRVEPGFDTHHVLTTQTALIGRHFASGRAVSGLVTDALHRLEALPDVEVAASTLTGVPLDAGAALNG